MYMWIRKIQTMQNNINLLYILSQLAFILLYVFTDILLYNFCIFPITVIETRIFLTGTMTACMTFLRLYSFRNLIMIEEMICILKAGVLMSVIDSLYLYSGGSGISLLGVLFADIVFIVLTMVARYYFRCSMFRLGFLVKKVLVVGGGKAGRTFADNIISSPFTLRRIAGFLDDDQEGMSAGVPVLGKVSELARVQSELRADVVVISDNSVPEEFAAQFGGDVYVLEEPDDEPSRNLSNPVHLAIKEVIDYTGALVALIMFSPVMIWAAYRIKREDGGSIFFYHTRFGKDLVPFRLCKFRTMSPEAAAMLAELLKNDEKLRAEFYRDFKLKNDPRITKIGHTLRNLSIDELPQLFNVLRGEMSLVGARPIVHKEARNYYGYPLSRHVFRLKPGMTGLWQVSGRNNVTDYDLRIKYDMYYIHNWSVWLDLAILVKTPLAVLSEKGAY